MTNKQLILKKTETVIDSTFLITLTYGFDKFIKTVLPEDAFDEYIVIGNPGVLYETFPSGLDFSDDSLLTHQSAITGSVIKDKSFGGIDYKLFIQPVICDRNTRLIVIGLILKEHHQHAKTKLPSPVIIFLITIFTAILVTFPIIKLYQLGKDDRLTITDTILSTIVSMLLVSLLFFSFVNYTSVLPDQHTKEQPMKVLADTISLAYLTEIKNNCEKLFNLDSLMASDSLAYQRNIFNVGKYPVQDINGKSLDSLPSMTAINKEVKDIDLDKVFWMRANGKEIFSWKADTTNVSFPGNFKKRAYFEKIIQFQGYNLTNGHPKNIWYLDQVISWIDGRFFTDISTQSAFPKARVVALSFNVKSLDEIKVPTGYTFAMIDREGKVLYHSKKKKNLNENLLSEFSNQSSLSKCLRTGFSVPFNTDYFGQHYKVRISGIGGGLPYYLVIMDNLSFVESRDIDVYSFTFSMQFLLFVLVIFQMLIIFFASSKRSVYQDQMFETNWVGPKRSSHREYIIATVFNLLIFAALCIFPYSSILSRLFMLLFSSTFLPVFLNLLFAQKYHQNKIKNLRQFKLTAAGFALVIPLSITIIGIINMSESLLNFLFFELLCIFLAALILRLNWIYNTDELPFFLNEKNYNKSFSALVFSWLLVTCGISVLVFFTAAYNYDQHLIARFKHFEFSSKLISDYQKKASEDTLAGRQSITVDSLSKTIYKDSFWVNQSNISADSSKEEIPEDEFIVNVLSSFRIYESEGMMNRKNLSQSRAFDFSYYFNNLMKQVIAQPDYTETNVRFQNNSNYLRIKSAKLNFSLPPFFEVGGFTCWLTLLISLAILAALFLSIINKLFALNIPDTSHWNLLDKELVRDEKNNFRLFVTGLPNSGKIELIEKIFSANSKLFVDLRLISTKGKAIEKLLADNDSNELSDWNLLSNRPTANDYNLIIINHFEYNFKDPKINNLKLRILEKLFFEADRFKKKIVVLSDIHASTLFNAITESNRQEADKPGTDKKGVQKQSIERWQDLLGGFRIVVHRLSQFNRKITFAPTSIIRKETQHCRFMNDYYEPAMKAFKKINKSEEETEISLAFKLQTTSYHYYFSIWQSLSKEEKFLLYDLAEDGLVNPFDKNTLCLLIDKGVIIRYDGRLKLFNQGFRHFILTGIGNKETEEIMEKVNDNRNWNKIKIPLALISLTIIAFLLSSQHETSTNLITTLTALAGIIPVFINFLSSLGSGNAPKAKG